MSRLPGLLFVHAHPDDESLVTGLALAHFARAGHPVHVLTCTLGEQGEVVPPALAHLAADQDDALGPYRREELRSAMAALGVDHEVLGEDPAAGRSSRWRDSGMAGTPSADDPRAFARADVEEATALVRAVIERVAPAVVVTYDRHGGYGHPDHIQTHRLVCAAVRGLGTAGPPLYAAVTPRSWAAQDRAWLAARVPTTSGWSVPGPDDAYPPSVVEDGAVTHELFDPSAVTLQVRALRCHATQVTVAADGLSYALSNDIAARLPGREGYARLDPRTGLLVPGPVEGVPRAGSAARGPVRGGLLADVAR